MQAQGLFQPYEISLEGANPREKYVATSVEFLRSNVDFLLTDTLQTNPPFKRHRTGCRIKGLGLPDDACEKLLHRNIERILGLDYS